MRRRGWLAGVAGAVAGSLAGCSPGTPSPPIAQWVGGSPQRGHRLRDASAARTPTTDAVPRQADVLVIGAGVAGLAAARALARRGLHDVQLLELEDVPGGNSRAHAIDGRHCPLGAHYLPLPGPDAVDVAEWLHELGLLRSELGRTVADERHLCHTPQERLFIDGSWHDGLLPPAADGSATLGQYRRFEAATTRAQRELGFAMPTHRARWSVAHERLDRRRFVDWLDAEGLTDARLRWYLDYACRDDYGAGLDTVSAWAGLHYFASRHGFHAPGSDSGERDAVFTWPEGNAWLIDRLARPFADGRLQLGRTVWRVDVQRRSVTVWCWDEALARAERWTARAIVLAVPLFVAARLLTAPPPGLIEAATLQRHAPWLVANVALHAPLLDRVPGAPPAWDNVRFGSASLGYVDAAHQSLQATPDRALITAYWALPTSERGALLAEGAAGAWSRRVIDDLAVAHPDLPAKVARIDLMRYGHAMSIPHPGVRSHPALAALARLNGPLAFAHADLAGYSVFEEAFAHGTRAGASLRLV